jgi:hypothetical protein
VYRWLYAALAVALNSTCVSGVFIWVECSVYRWLYAALAIIQPAPANNTCIVVYFCYIIIPFSVNSRDTQPADDVNY